MNAKNRAEALAIENVARAAIERIDLLEGLLSSAQWALKGTRHVALLEEIETALASTSFATRKDP